MNRRIRNRTYGGVGGRRVRTLLLPDRGQRLVNRLQKTSSLFTLSYFCSHLLHFSTICQPPQFFHRAKSCTYIDAITKTEAFQGITIRGDVCCGSHATPANISARLALRFSRRRHFLGNRLHWHASGLIVPARRGNNRPVFHRPTPKQFFLFIVGELK